MKKISKDNIIKNILFTGLLAVSVLLSSSSFAEKYQYDDATIRRLTDHLFEEKMINFDDAGQFKEYAMIEDCEIFETYFNNDFEWNRIRLAVKEEMSSLKPSTKKTRVRLPGKVDLTRYNFTTQSFDIYDVDVFNNVGFLQISERKYDLCDKNYDEGDIQNLPQKYFLKPEVPFNLFRIPVSKALARQVLDKIPPNKKDRRTAYIDINVTLDAFFEINAESDREKYAYVLGSVDQIDFYIDKEKRNKFKTLYYDEY